MVQEIGGAEHRLRDRKDVLSALGAINFYRSMIPNAVASQPHFTN
jgi:hypothetical protein